MALPGVDGTDVFLRPFIERAPPDVRAVALEDPQTDADSYEELAEIVRRALPTEGDVYLLGWSFSGPLAVILGAERLSQVRGLILVGTFVRRPIPYLPSWARHFARPSLFRLYPTASMAKALVAGYSTPSLRALQAEAFDRTSHAGMANRVRALLSVDARPQLRDCDLPILYLRSLNDRVVHRSCGDEIMKEAKRASLVELDAPHLSLTTHPDEAWNAIATFIDEAQRNAG